MSRLVWPDWDCRLADQPIAQFRKIFKRSPNQWKPVKRSFRPSKRSFRPLKRLYRQPKWSFRRRKKPRHLPPTTAHSFFKGVGGLSRGTATLPVPTAAIGREVCGEAGNFQLRFCAHVWHAKLLHSRPATLIGAGASLGTLNTLHCHSNKRYGS